jgi:hypothetical protein
MSRVELLRQELLVFGVPKEHDDVIAASAIRRPMASSVPRGPGRPAARQASRMPNECSVALLPLRNLSGAREDEPLCAGITGDIIHNLTRFRDLTVIAQHSALQINALALPPRQVAERLGVRYLLAGDLQRKGDDFGHLVLQRKHLAEGPLGPEPLERLIEGMRKAA